MEKALRIKNAGFSLEKEISQIISNDDNSLEKRSVPILRNE